jgi:hypothetical protein
MSAVKDCLSKPFDKPLRVDLVQFVTISCA